MSAQPFDQYIAKAAAYAQPILKELRRVVHSAHPGIGEELKWSAPTFMKNGMVCSMHAFKSYVGFWFHKGALLKDKHKVLEPGVTAHTMMNVKYATAAQIDAKAIVDLVRQAVALNEKGVKIPVKRNTKPVMVPAALKRALKKNPKAARIFDAMAPSHRREYAGYVAEAKQAETVERRVGKVVAQVLKSQSLHHKYR